ncbi:pentatricopeptide repeat-containing protein At2g20710, mitochondrial-like isoform X3 [Actinidia eriantha]|uniref:pentatricopeptide repeat-containing protein At2g20710, mitochondrial-like isoform X3 n=1 Tax=Actinidia eriantha TaxID=165200 RepID=UPI002588447F|nr:pentatricopeptide repeat-containing protein At2g20710, mitochondrial-like isoform X3 [Actinidia eriantha]
MKLVGSVRRLNLNTRCRLCFGKFLLYSTITTVSAPAKSGDSLYRRISPLGDPTVSIVPVLDQWVQEGRTVKKGDLENIIKELRRYSRFKHALEISQWMSDGRCCQLSIRDIAVRLDLISKVHGTEQAEYYFNSIPEQWKAVEVYSVLLYCHAREKSVEKAEAIMQKMRELGLDRTTLTYNLMLNLYRQTEKRDKLDELIHEMEQKGIKYDKFTFGTLLTIYADFSDIEGMNGLLQRMESDPKLVLDWNVYSIAANGFIRAGLTEKALAMLKKSEDLILASKRRSMAFDFLLTQYATIGKKDEVLRLWEVHKKSEKLYNKSYISMITSLLKLDDIEGAEKVFEEWESSELCYDFRVPNFLIGAYCRKGLMEKAEAFVNRTKMRGGKPLPNTWYFLAAGYVTVNQMPKAVEAMKLAVSACDPGWKPSKPTLVALLEYLKENGNVEKAEEFLRLLLAKGVVSTDVYDRVLNYMKNAKLFSQESDLVEEDTLGEDGEPAENQRSLSAELTLRDGAGA